jgi:hypothetical protein
MEFPDADLKIGAAGKWQHFQKNFFYRLVRQRHQESEVCFAINPLV